MEFREIRPIRRGTRHVPTCWLSLFTMFKTVEGLGADDCLAASWIFLAEQEDEMASDEQPHHSVTVGLYFTHFFVSSIQDRPTCSLQFSSWRNGQQFPMKRFVLNHGKVSIFVKEEERRQVFLACSKNCLGLARRIDKFVSLHKSHHLLGEVLSFRQIHHIVISSLLAWSLQITSPSLDEVLQIWVMVPWSNAFSSNGLHMSLVSWIWYSIEFNNELAPILLKLVQYNYYGNSCVKCMRGEDFQCHGMNGIRCLLNL